VLSLMTAIRTSLEDLAMNEPQQRAAKGGGTLDGRQNGCGPQSEPATELPSAAGVERVGVVVIGGAQAGLAAGYELAQRGIDFVILERGSRLGENWRPGWDSLRLFTPARFDGLPGFPFYGEEGRYLTKDQMSEYLEQYAERFGLPVRLGIDVLGLTPDERGQILVEWEHGRLAADQVIVAADLQAAQRRTTHDRDRRMIQLRAGEYRTLSQLSQIGEVVVLGAGSTRLAAGSSPREVASRAAHFRSR
jgi:putative flavoprotein involved in K+ transport